MAIITLLGAGSTVFAKNLLGDILSFPELANSEIRLFDIDLERLKTSEVVANKVAQALGAKARNGGGDDALVAQTRVAGVVRHWARGSKRGGGRKKT